MHMGETVAELRRTKDFGDELELDGGRAQTPTLDY
jgi:hypothetical protein